LSQWSQKLDAYMAAKGISKRELAEELGTSIDTIGKWWRNREPSPQYAAKLERLLGEVVATSPSATRESGGVKTASTQPSQEESKQKSRYEERSVVVSLQRTTCPFCQHTVERFRGCTHCGQHFVWANVPVVEGSTARR